MTNTIFTTKGCSRCKILKRFLEEKEVAYKEYDFKEEGKKEFNIFYRQNRSHIFRGKNGIEFPIFTDGNEIRQGVGLIAAYLQSGKNLDGFIGRSTLSKGWIDGLHISGGNPTFADEFIKLLTFLKINGLKLQLETNGKNPEILEGLNKKGLGDRAIMDLKGPLTLYETILGEKVDPEEIIKTILVITQFPDYRFQTTISPVVRSKGLTADINYLTPQEIGETARLIEESTGSKKQPYYLMSFDPETATDQHIKGQELLPANALFKYRSLARKHQILTEIGKQ